MNPKGYRDKRCNFRTFYQSINQAYQRTQERRRQNQVENSPVNPEAPNTNQRPTPEPDGAVGEWTGGAPVFISMEHYGALHQLGGFVEGHLETAIELYLEAKRIPHQEFHADDYDHESEPYGDPYDAPDADAHPDAEPEEEMFDPDMYPDDED